MCEEHDHVVLYKSKKTKSFWGGGGAAGKYI